jgi:hypothetical protein
MKKSSLFIQIICSDCLQSIVIGCNEMDENELNEMDKTLNLWAKDNYFPFGLTNNTEPFFSWSKCELCNQLAGDRYEYYFISKQY